MKPRKNLAFTIIFILSINWTPSVYSQTNFNEMLSNGNVGVISDSLLNMQYLYDEFEQSYVVFPKKKDLDKINSIDDVDWLVFNMMDRQDKGYSNQLSLMLLFEMDEKFIEEQSETIFVLDDERIKFPYMSEITENNSALILFLLYELEDWTKIYTASNSRFRLYGRIFELPSDLKKIMLDMHDVVNQLIEKEFPKEELKEEPKAELEDNFFVVVEQMPQLRGGLASLQRKVRYPEEARRMGIEGRVTVQFIVGVDGSIENPRVIRGIGGGCDEEALRVIKTATFNPGKQRGRPVRVQYSLPIVFRL